MYLFYCFCAYLHVHNLDNIHKVNPAYLFADFHVEMVS